MDSGVPPHYSDLSLIVNILDVNDNTPIIESQGGYNVSISEVRHAHTSVSLYNHMHVHTNTHISQLHTE